MLVMCKDTWLNFKWSSAVYYDLCMIKEWMNLMKNVKNMNQCINFFYLSALEV